MKTMTCEQLGGACDMEFDAASFEEIAELSKQHGMEMFQQKDEAHLKAMNEMQELMKEPEAMKAWFENKKKEFDALPESKCGKVIYSHLTQALIQTRNGFSSYR